MKKLVSVLPLFCMLFQIAYSQPTGNTVALWHFDESTGSNVADSSPYANHGTAFGTTIVPGELGNARYFNGFGDYVLVGDPPNGSLDFPDGQSFTIEVWFKTTSLNNQAVLRKGLAPVPGYELKIENGRVVTRIGNREDGVPPDTLLTIMSTALFNDDQWHKATVVRDQSQRRFYLYVDEALAAQPVSDPIHFSLTNDRPLTIGRWENPTLPVYFTGSIDEARVFQDARHPSTVVSDTLALWHMDETGGSIVHDSSPYGKNGTALGANIVPGQSGNAREFDGINDYIYVQLPLTHLDFSTTQSFTVQAWFKTTIASGTNEIVRRGLAPVPGFTLRVEDGRVQGIIGNREDGVQPDTLLRITSDNLYDDGQWHHAVMVRDRSVQKLFLYVDGLPATTPLHDPVPFALSNARPLTIGTWENFTVPAWFNGTIDEVGIFNRARHPSYAVGPIISLSTGEINFGIVPVGTTRTMPLTVFNLGLQDTLSVTSISSTAPEFTPLATSLQIPPQSYRSVEIAYSPATLETDTATLFIASNDSLHPVVQVGLSGHGFVNGPAPAISSIRDIPNDQGKQVRVIWYRSIFDVLGDSVHITAYGVWRRVDDPNSLAPPPGVAPGTVFSINGHTLVVTTNELWDFIVTIPAVQFEQYAYVAPTLYDSTHIHGMHWSVFRVSAHADNGGVYFSDPDSGYSLDNLPPSPPTNVNGSFNGGTVLLGWDIPPDPDLSHYTVHRSTVPNFIPDATTAIGSPHVNSFVDTSPGSSPAVYYRVVSFDSAGNQSPFSDVAAVLLTGIGDVDFIPEVFALHQNYPNPFNPETIISYDVPMASHVTLSIFDVNGREVQRLVNGFEQPGRYFVTWTPRTVASGIYLCRMIAGKTTFTRKMVILK